MLWDASKLARVRECGRFSVADEGMVGVKLTPGRQGGKDIAGLSGLSTCGSVWACPVCSAKIAAGRFAELQKIIAYYVEQGKSVYLVTQTMRHHAGQSLDECWRTLSYAWDKTNSGKQWKRDKELFDLDGYVRVVETTHGLQNGWHVHTHILLCFDREISTATAEHIAQGMYQRWHNALVRKGFDSLPEWGIDVRRADVYAADYLAKTVYREDPDLAAAVEQHRAATAETNKGLAAEAALGVFKEARHGNRTPFQILHAIIAGREIGADTSRDEALWAEWEQSSKGRRQLLPSRGLRTKVGLDEEQKTDEELAAEDELSGDTVVYLPPETWRVIKWEAEFMLAAFEDGLGEGLAYLAQRGLLAELPSGDAAC